MKGMPLKIGNLTLRKPIFQGGMGIGISLSGLAGAVAAEGGAGTISAAQIGFLEEDFDENPLKANLRAMGKELKKARELARGGVVGFNIMVAMNHYGEYVKEAARLGADFIVSGAGLPADLPALVKAFPIKIAPIVSTEKSARVLLQYWAKKFNRIPDFLVIEGPKAGGHLGFTKEQLQEFGPDTYGQEVEKIIGQVRAYEARFEKKIPVVLGGGDQAMQSIGCGAGLRTGSGCHPGCKQICGHGGMRCRSGIQRGVPGCQGEGHCSRKESGGNAGEGHSQCFSGACRGWGADCPEKVPGLPAQM